MSVTLGVTYNGKHSYDDFGVWIKSKTIGTPKKNKYTASVPYMDGSYDFSLLYGEQTYSDRQLQYVFEIIESTKQKSVEKKTKVINWLLDSSKGCLIDDTMPEFYFWAECIDVTPSEAGRVITLTATFTAYPYRYGTWLEGDSNWSSYTSEWGTVTPTAFSVANNSTTSITSVAAHTVTAKVNCIPKICITHDGTTTALTAETENYTIPSGRTTVSLAGYGSLELSYTLVQVFNASNNNGYLDVEGTITARVDYHGTDSFTASFGGHGLSVEGTDKTWSFTDITSQSRFMMPTTRSGYFNVTYTIVRSATISGTGTLLLLNSSGSSAAASVTLQAYLPTTVDDVTYNFTQGDTYITLSPGTHPVVMHGYADIHFCYRKEII